MAEGDFRKEIYSWKGPIRHTHTHKKKKDRKNRVRKRRIVGRIFLKWNTVERAIKREKDKRADYKKEWASWVGFCQRHGYTSAGRAMNRHAGSTQVPSIPRFRQVIVLRESTFSAHSLTVPAQPPRVQSHALTSVRTWKAPSSGSHTFVWTHGNAARTVRKGLPCSCSCLPR